MDIKQLSEKMFSEIVRDYENEKMMRNGGYVCRTKSSEFLKKFKRSGLHD